MVPTYFNKSKILSTFDELVTGFHNLLNDTKVVIFGSKLAGKLGVTTFIIDLTEDQPNVADGGS